MDITPGILSLVMTIASLGVFGLLLHYVSRVGRRRDMLCVCGLLAVEFGLLAGAMGYRSAPSLKLPDLFSGISLGLALCAAAFAIWREGLRRFRDAR